MGQKNDDFGNAGIGIPAEKNENPKGEAKKGDAPREEVKNAVKMDINRYLLETKDSNGKSINDMFRVMFKGEFLTKEEWTKKVNEVINRRAV
jgi:hypothetical protein